jgi:hypothetical protein
MQQPPPQVRGPQFGLPWQMPPPVGWAVQVCPVAVQLVHVLPFSPQAVAAVPGRHWLPTQQPLQFEASHLPVLHVRVDESQERPWSEQSTHWMPLRPQAEASVPARQRWRPPSKLQQPFGQVDVLQSGSSRPQTRFAPQSLKPSATQSEQRPPADPHARVSVPVRHVPDASQHPVGQFDALQAFGGWIPLSPVVSSSRLDRPQAGVAIPTRNSASTAIAASTTKRPSCVMRMEEGPSFSIRSG